MRKISSIILTTAVVVSIFFWAGCSGNREEKRIRIGSKNFTEQFILAEMMAQLIEAKTDIRIDRAFNLGGTMICHQALLKGEIDLYAEYTGTGLTTILHRAPENDPEKVFRLVSEGYYKYQLMWLQPFGFNNTYTLTMRQGDARQKKISSISDLVTRGEELSAGFTAEFIERPDGYPGLIKRYGLTFQSVRDMDPGLMYKAIAAGEVDVICAFSSDGRIPAYDLVTLEDDRSFFPPYFAAPVVRLATLKKYPELEPTLKLLANRISDRDMRRLNYEVDEEKRPPAEVARTFLNEAGLF